MVAAFFMSRHDHLNAILERLASPDWDIKYAVHKNFGPQLDCVGAQPELGREVFREIIM